MEMNDKSDQFELDKSSYPLNNYQNSGFSDEAGPSMPFSQQPQAAAPHGAFSSMANAFPSVPWIAPSNPGGQFLASIPGMLHNSFPHISADSGFIERAAARYSCFNNNTLNPFSSLESLNGYPDMGDGYKDANMVSGGYGSNNRSPREQKDVEILHGGGGSSHIGGSTESDSCGGSQEAGPSGNHKRKRPNQKEIADDKPATSTQKSNGKQVKDAPDPKEEYIHVRARRGQATNSHSLAERVRREKISARMKLLQDLVPGCSKVTGKAVMLDEIINYVQSLQRQVEFLSMKLAAVNPRLDFNIESIISKNIFNPHGFGSSSMPPLPETVHSQLHPSQLLQAGMPGAVASADAMLKRVATPQLFKGTPCQMPNPWQGELDRSFLPVSLAPLNIQDPNNSSSSKIQDHFPS